MAIRPRNIALEGFADDFIDPRTLAVVGLAVSASGEIEAALDEVSPAQTDGLAGTVAQHAIHPPSGTGGGGSRSGGRRGGPWWNPSPDPKPIARPARVALLSEIAPAQTEEIVCTARIRSLSAGGSPAQTDTIDTRARAGATLLEVSPAQVGDARGTVLDSGLLVESGVAQAGAGIARVSVGAQLSESAPAQDDRATALVTFDALLAERSPAQVGRACVALSRIDSHRNDWRHDERVERRFVDRAAEQAARYRRAS